MNRKALLIVVLMMHLLVHPLAHAFSEAAPTSHGTTISARGDLGESGDECTLCRVAGALTIFVLLALLFAPRACGRCRIIFESPVLSVALLSQLPSRAPPRFA